MRGSRSRPPRSTCSCPLADGDKHGYAILKDVKRRTADRVSLSVATLYAVLKRLMADGLIEETSTRPDPALDDERRRYYRLSVLGLRVAKAEARRLEDDVAIARSARLLGKPRPA